MRKITQKKAQMGIENAPAIVLIVGLTFLTLATVAFIGEKYGNTLDVDNSFFQVVNETLTTVTENGEYFEANRLETPVCEIYAITNSSDGILVPTTNYTQTNCFVAFTGAISYFNNTDWNVSYNVSFSEHTVASNTTDDLQTNISDNTSIAGIILTISLIGIVLTILIGVFLGMRRTRI